MWYSAVSIIILSTIVVIGFAGYSLAKDNNPKNSKSELVDKLINLKDIKVSDPMVGAMCYDTAAPMERVEYICPICGEKTLYIKDYDIDVEKIPYYRNLIKKITKIDVKLDESQFCSKCNPSYHLKSRELCLMVKYGKDSKPHRTCGITEQDINLLYEFSEGKKIHVYSPDNDGLIPLMNYKDRIEELLGVPIKPIK